MWRPGKRETKHKPVQFLYETEPWKAQQKHAGPLTQRQALLYPGPVGLGWWGPQEEVREGAQ